MFNIKHNMLLNIPLTVLTLSGVLLGLDQFSGKPSSNITSNLAMKSNSIASEVNGKAQTSQNDITTSVTDSNNINNNPQSQQNPQSQDFTSSNNTASPSQATSKSVTLPSNPKPLNSNSLLAVIPNLSKVTNSRHDSDSEREGDHGREGKSSYTSQDEEDDD